MLEWLIVGGGLHGTHLSLALTRRAGISLEQIRILDPHPRLLALWDHFAANTGMEFLRSSHAHNLHYDPFSLRTFSLTYAGKPHATFTHPYGRPALPLFQAHNQQLIKRNKLDEIILTGRANKLERTSEGWCIHTDTERITARNVLLAIGSSEQPYYPDWAHVLSQTGVPIHHIFDPRFHRTALQSWSHAVVIGGGISAVQTALAMLQQQEHGQVTLLMRHPIRVQTFDSDPCWVTNLCLDTFHKDKDYDQRRELIMKTRHKGTMPEDVAHLLQTAVTRNHLTRRMGQVLRAEQISAKWMSLYFDSQAEPLKTDCVILATGFDQKRPGGRWLDQAIDDYQLPYAPCGYPIVDESLRWQPGLYVTGPLAELEIGPVARNIIGARLAGERIIRALKAA